MNVNVDETRPTVPSIFTVYRPIEEYWERTYAGAGSKRETWDALKPLDAFLVHRLIELIPKDTILIDHATAVSGGASSFLALVHPRVREVWAVNERDSLEFKRAITAIRADRDDCGESAAKLVVIPQKELSDKAGRTRGLVHLVDARSQDLAALAADITRWLEARPDALVIVLSVGTFGSCPALASLLGLCAPGSGLRLNLPREHSEALLASRLALVARNDHPQLALTLERLAQSYRGNYNYIELLEQVNDSALRTAALDETILRNHLTFGPISAEIEELKRLAREAIEREAVTARALQEARAQLEAVSLSETTLLVQVRRFFAPTAVGRAYRAAKKLRSRFIGRVNPRWWPGALGRTEKEWSP
jgi:hypothetical protein